MASSEKRRQGILFRELETSLNMVNARNDKGVGESRSPASLRTRQLQDVLSLSHQFTLRVDRQELLRAALHQVCEILDCEVAAILFKGRNGMEIAVSQNLTPSLDWTEFARVLARTVTGNGHPGTGIARASAADRSPLVDGMPESVRCYLAHSLWNHSGRDTGALVLFNKQERTFDTGDERVIEILARLIGQQVENAELFEQIRETFSRFARALSTAVDERDMTMAGHSLRVADYSTRVAAAMNLPELDQKRLYIAALLHDLGKVEVPEDILQKPGPLTLHETRIVQRHVEVTQTLLSRMTFPPGFEDVPGIACQHHEKIDGTGYPNGLRGEEIGLLGRILAVADVFDALTSERHYRAPMARDEALALLEEKSGQWFDTRVVETIRRIIDEELPEARVIDVAPGTGFHHD